MKMRYIGERSDPMALIKGRIYECTGYQCVIGYDRERKKRTV